MDSPFGQLSVLVVGAGSIGRRHAANLLSLGVGTVAVTDTDPSRLESILPGESIKRYGSPGEALHAGPHAVFVCTPPTLHADYTLSALAAGSHVFVEKPVASDLSAIARIRAEKLRQGRLVQVGYNLAYHPGLRLVRESIESIGTVLWARAEFGQYLPDWRPWQDYRTGYTARRELGGGIIFDASHEIDYLCRLLGEVREVQCMAASLGGLEIDVEDSAVINLRFNSGALGVAQLDMVQRVYSRSCKVVGSLGTIEWNYAGGEVRIWTAETGVWNLLPYEFEANSMYVAEVKDFLERASGQSEPVDNFESAVKVLEIALAAKESSETHRTITL